MTFFATVVPASGNRCRPESSSGAQIGLYVKSYVVRATTNDKYSIRRDHNEEQHMYGARDVLHITMTGLPAFLTCHVHLKMDTKCNSQAFEWRSIYWHLITYVLLDQSHAPSDP